MYLVIYEIPYFLAHSECKSKVVMVVHVRNPKTQEACVGGLKFKAILSFIESFKPVWPQSDTLSQK
jgi:hypothetical protein